MPIVIRATLRGNSTGDVGECRTMISEGLSLYALIHSFIFIHFEEVHSLLKGSPVSCISYPLAEPHVWPSGTRDMYHTGGAAALYYLEK